MKAAVMKYGLNQWDRVASVMSSKSARQCKARWFGWLDPGVRKREWTRSEDDLLVHVLRIFPRQWQTVAPVVGRTSSQCIERYCKLVDLTRNCCRLSEPGKEHFFRSEHDAALPDTFDSLSYDSVAVSEVRARLSNTKGKKAKRRARESMLESVRVHSLRRKKDDLRAAGICLSDGGFRN
jgi:pre-mRNA-splicing factor CDC5/CEF1